MRRARSLLPILSWAPGYRRDDLQPDLAAGCSEHGKQSCCFDEGRLVGPEADADRAADLGQDRVVVRVPGAQHRARLDVLLLVDEDQAADLDRPMRG